MIHSGRAGPAGSVIELHRGSHVIVAQVMWFDGSQAGLYSDQRLPVEEILSTSQSIALQLVASDGAVVERRKQPREASPDARTSARLIEFGAAAIIALSLSLAIWGMAREAFAQPIAEAEAALSFQR